MLQTADGPCKRTFRWLLLSSKVCSHLTILPAYLHILCVSADNRSPVLLMAAEKRFNFTLNELDARAHAHEHFCKLAQQQDSGLQCMRLDAAMVPQFLEYERGSDLELWLIQCKGPGT